MSMQPQLWSLSALSVEFGIDRRTIAKRLTTANVRPAGTKAGAPVYWLRDAVPVVALGNPGGTPGNLREVFGCGEPFVKYLMTKGLSLIEAIDATLDIWELFNRSTREVFHKELLHGLPLDLATPEDIDDFLARMRRDVEAT